MTPPRDEPRRFPGSRGRRSDPGGDDRYRDDRRDDRRTDRYRDDRRDDRYRDDRRGDRRGDRFRGDRYRDEPDPARAAALELLAAVRERGAYANLVMGSILRDRRLTGRDAALATELGYGACRALGQLDAIAAACTDREMDGPVLDAVRLGAYQLLHTRIPPHAAVSASVELVRHGPRPQAAGYVNAVLRRISERSLDQWIDHLAPVDSTDPLARLGLATAHPRWIVAALADALGNDEELPAALAANQEPPAVHLVARPGLITRDELADEARGEVGHFSPQAVYLPAGDPARLSAIRSRAAAVQDEGSQLVALALTNATIDDADARWLDLAAGPGGKAGLIGAIAAGRGATVDAVEIADHRADLVRQTVQGLPVTVHTADGRDPGLPEGSFDRVLLDAPCTGLGALRRRPESRWRRTEADVAPLVTLQRELLAAAARLVRPGGVIGYITCSPHLAETIGVIERRPDGLELIDARDYFPHVPDLGDGPTVQLWPHRHGTDAMFCALLRRTT